MASDRVFCWSLHLKALTPVHVGAGKEQLLSPYTDFVQKGPAVYYVDQAKVQALLARDPALVDAFVRGVRDGVDNTRSSFSLEDFLGNRLNVKLPDVSRASLAVIGGKIGRVQIRRVLSDGGRPYLPGSSLKGAIRAALFHHWLTTSERGTAELGALAERVRTLWARHEGELRELEELDDRGGRRPPRDDDERRRRLRDTLRQPEKTLSRSTSMQEELFGRLTAAPGDQGFEGPLMRFLRVGDSSVLDPATLAVAQVSRLKLRDASEVSPQWSEVLRAGTSAAFSIGVTARFSHPDLAFLNDGDLRELWSRVNRFALASANLEAQRLLAAPDGFGAAANLYRDLVALIERARGDFGVLRVGAFKTYFDNSMGLALFARDPVLFEKFRKLVGLGKNPKTRVLAAAGFPTTRSFAGSSRVPLGWLVVGERPPADALQLPDEMTRTASVPASIELEAPAQPVVAAAARPPNVFRATITDAGSRPPRVRLAEGTFAGQETILPGVNLENLGLRVGDTVFVTPVLDRGTRRLVKSDYKGKP
jgi:CRISPR-associated protein Csm5